MADLDASRFPLQGRKGVWPVYLIFDDLRALLESRTFIVGGDLNADPVMDDRPRFVGGNREFFDGLERNGFVNLAAGSGPTHRGYKLDYVFGSRDLSPSVRSSRADEKAIELWNSVASVTVSYPPSKPVTIHDDSRAPVMLRTRLPLGRPGARVSWSRRERGGRSPLPFDSSCPYFRRSK